LPMKISGRNLKVTLTLPAHDVDVVIIRIPEKKVSE